VSANKKSRGEERLLAVDDVGGWRHFPGRESTWGRRGGGGGALLLATLAVHH